MKIVIGLILFDDNRDILLKNLDMIFKQTTFTLPDISHEIIIIDNCKEEVSGIKSIIANHQQQKKVTMLTAKNVGLNTGHNLIFNYAKNQGNFDYYLSIDSSGIAHHQMLEQLINFAKSKFNNGIFESLQFPLQHPKLYDKESGETEWCLSHCRLFPYNIFESLGGFDEELSYYLADVDFSWRVKIAGYNCYTVNKSLFSPQFNTDNNPEEIVALKSAYKLAKKYNNKTGINQFSKKLRALLTKDEYQSFIADCNLKSLAVAAPQNLTQSKIPNFNNGLFFSKTKW